MFTSLPVPALILVPARAAYEVEECDRNATWGWGGMFLGRGGWVKINPGRDMGLGNSTCASQMCIS